MSENIYDDNEEGTRNSGGLKNVQDSEQVTTTKANAAQAKFEEFDETYLSGRDINGEKLSLLQDLMLNIYIELGRTQVKVKHILELERGYVIELDKLASEPVEIYANNKKIAEGEVVVIDKHFGIRITNLVEPGRRLEGI